MKKTLIKILSVMLVVVITLTSAPLSGFVGLELPDWLDFSIKSSAAETSGALSSDLTWTLNDSTGTLTISGNGWMNTSSAFCPWENYRDNIISIVIENGVKSISGWAFAHCKNLTNIIIPDSVTKIDESAFRMCTSLKSVSIPDSVTQIDSEVFYDCESLENIIIGENLNSLVIDAFDCCYSLKNINVSVKNQNFSSDEYGALFNKNKTTLIRYPIGNARTSYTIPNSVITIYDTAFRQGQCLESITIPDSVTEIGLGTFDAWYSLLNITVDSNNQYYSSDENGVLFNKDKDMLYLYPKGKLNSNYIVPNTVQNIFVCAFEKTALKNITIPVSVYIIEDQAFYNSALTDVYYLGTDEEWNRIYIGSYRNDPFLNATIHFNSTGDRNQCGDDAYYIYNDKTQKLVVSGSGPMWDYEEGKSPFLDMQIKEVIIKDEVSSIGSYAFSGCKSLKVVRFGERIKSIGKDAFDGCDLAAKGDSEFKEERGIYYFGTSAEFKKISVSSSNETFDEAKKIYTYSCREYENEEAASTKNVFDGKVSALTNHIVPGIYDDMIPQGLAYYKEKNWFLISAYHETKGEKKPGVIYALDKDTGEFVAQFNLYNVGGTPCTAHLGGIAVSDNNVYVTYYDNKIAYLPLEEINVDKYTVKDIKLSGSLDIAPLAEAKSENGNNPAKTAYIEVCDGVLWTGNFYNANILSSIGWLSESYGYKATKKNNTIMVGYQLSGNNSDDEWASIGNKEKYRIKLANDVNSIQGATIDNNKLYISVTTGASFGAEVWAANLSFNDKNVAEVKKKNFTYKGKNIDGAEEIVIVDGYLYSVYESAALSNHGDFAWGDWLKSTSGAMTKVKLSDLKAKTNNIFNCPIDIEVIDSANGETVCRIVNNIIDEEIASKENALLAEVDGDTKYIYTPNDKNYEFRITGNGTGKMDYTVVKVDEYGCETERINFFDVEITEKTTLFGDLNLSENNFELSDYVLNGTVTVNASEYIASASEKLNINISAAIGGYASDSVQCTSGDVIEIFAVCDDGYAFDGWYENNNFVSDNMEYTFVAKSDRTLEARFKHVDHNYTFEIKQPSRTEIRNKDGIILHANVEGAAPNGSYVKWESSNGNFDTSADGSNLKIIAKNKGYTTFTAILCDADGNELARDSVEMYSKSGFFDKIGGFFRSLFGTTKIYEN